MKLWRLLGVMMAIGAWASAFAANEGWMTDLEAAKAKAAKEGKPLLIEFTGSTWCPPCKSLNARVLTTPEFAEFARGVVLVVLDFPSSRERTPEKVSANPALARLMALKDEYKVTGFPTVFLYSPDGKQLGKIVGYGSELPNQYLARLQAAPKLPARTKAPSRPGI